jgi:NAD(P)-dependent dehydrogenase (short-subunit alcohol dehydrogenase family)
MTQTRSGSLDGRVALVVGCSPGINAGIAEQLALRGATIACVDKSAEYAEACATWLTAAGFTAVGLTADITDDEQAGSCVDQVVEQLGSLDVLVNGAAIETWHSALESSPDEFRRHLEVILVGAFSMSRHAAQAMIRRGSGGSIINLGSTEAHQGRPGNVGYGVSKAALLHLTKVLAMELAEHGIRVNSLTPTGTDPAEGDARREAWDVTWTPAVAPRRPGFTRGDDGVPLGRRPSPSDYGHAAAFLAGDEARSVTGIDLRVDGGVVSRYWRWSPSAHPVPEHRNGGES